MIHSSETTRVLLFASKFSQILYSKIYFYSLKHFEILLRDVKPLWRDDLKRLCENIDVWSFLPSQKYRLRKSQSGLR